jgi:hypothetical protein
MDFFRDRDMARDDRLHFAATQVWVRRLIANRRLPYLFSAGEDIFCSIGLERSVPHWRTPKRAGTWGKSVQTKDGHSGVSS